MTLSTQKKETIHTIQSTMIRDGWIVVHHHRRRGWLLPHETSLQQWNYDFVSKKPAWNHPTPM